MKSNKMLIVFIPIAALVMGVMVWESFFKEETKETPMVERDFADIDVKKIETVDSKAELYKKKWNREREKAELAKRVESEEDFFEDKKEDDSKSREKKEDDKEPEQPQANTQQTTTKTTASTTTVKKTHKQQVTQAAATPPVETVVEPQKKRRVRTDLPSFDDGAQSERVQASAEDQDAGTAKEALAVINGDQSITDGSQVTVRLDEPLTVNSKCTLPENTVLTGLVAFSGLRASFTFKSPCSNDQLSVYDYYDGYEGIYIDKLNDDQQIKKEAAEGVVTEGFRQLKVPILNRTGSNATQKKMSSPVVPVPNGRKLKIRIKPTL